MQNVVRYFYQNIDYFDPESPSTTFTSSFVKPVQPIHQPINFTLHSRSISIRIGCLDGEDLVDQDNNRLLLFHCQFGTWNGFNESSVKWQCTTIKNVCFVNTTRIKR